MEDGREIAFMVLKEVFNNGGYSNIVLSNYINNSNLNDKDKSLLTQIVYGTIKYKYTIDKIIAYFVKDLKHLDDNVMNILRISIYQMRFLDKVPDFAIVNEAVNLTKKVSSIKFSKLVNGVLRNYIRNSTSFDNNKELDFIYSFPQWMLDLFMDQYGDEIGEKILKGLNYTPYVSVRVNNLKGNFDDIFSSLESKNYDIVEGTISPECIYILKGSSIENNELFINGSISVQDESAMLVGDCMEIEEGLIIGDLCSAPGGKSCHIGELLNNTGKVNAYDIHKNKASLIEENVNRLGLENIEFNVMDATSYNKQLNNYFDRILIDAPCSGLGIIRKKPEIKWNKNIKDLKSIIEVQRKILVNGSKYLKEGGYLIYSTCTLNRKENEDNIKWFLKNNKNFVSEKIYFGDVENLLYSEDGFVTILPNQYMDGFFIAKLKKIGG